jgi:hypothetical protein
VSRPVGYSQLDEVEQRLLPDEVVTDFVKGYITLADVQAIRRHVLAAVRVRIYPDMLYDPIGTAGEPLGTILDEEAAR